MGRGLKFALGGVAVVGFALTAFAGESAKKASMNVEPNSTITQPAIGSATTAVTPVANPNRDKAVAFISHCEELRATWYDATLSGEYGKADHAMRKLEKLLAKEGSELGVNSSKRNEAAKEIVETRSVTNRYRLISLYLDLVKKDCGIPSGVYAVHHEK